MKTSYKTAKTIKYFETVFGGYLLAIPAGSIVSNSTAMGYDDNYRFLTNVNFGEIAEKATGFKNSILFHDLTHYGLNIPQEYCEDYP